VTAFALNNSAANPVVVLNAVEVSKILRGPTGMVMRDLIKRAERVQLAAQRQIPLGHIHAGPTQYSKGVGNLRYSLRKRIVPGGSSGSPTVLVGTDVPYAIFVHQGTRPHIIRPRTKKVLVFYIGSQKIVARTVHHPGTKPNRFLTDNLKYAII
jgi:hypothetical protein